MKLTPEGYMPRVVDALLERYLRVFGAVEVAGTKWCGKTWTSLAHAQSVSFVEDSLGLAAADPSMMLVGERPHLVDEWQLIPTIWDATRREVDRQSRSRGAFILTGSSTPHGGANAPVHSGAGRIGRIRMRPMSLAESRDSSAAVSFSALFEGSFSPTVVPRDTARLVELAVRGGWPEAIDLPAQDAQLIARSYLNTTFSESVPQLGCDSDLARRVCTSVARNLGQAATYKTIIGDLFAPEDQTSGLMDEDKVRAYLELLKSMYLVEEVPGWVPQARSRKRFATKPKRYLADPSLAAALLGLLPDALLNDWQTFGLLFENLAMRDLMVYASALELADEHPVRYYRDDSGLEADAIVQLADGRWAALEFKVSEDKVETGIKSLMRLRKKVCDNPASRTKPPTFMAVITGNGEYAREADGVYVIPLRALGA